MKKTYLIQRGKFASTDKKGIDGLLSFDYMGSAEFEWGALPKSLDRVRASQKEYIKFDFINDDYPDKSITVLCKDKDRLEIITNLILLANNQIRLKENCDLDSYLKNDKDYRTSDFWWDIENDFFFWRTNQEFETEFSVKLFNN